ncbi:MAG TPA: DNA gyrase C-terminal beta-propeller domain-containing protein, partial [Saprospiraceae bacterium]|nr:DNA gyrase C-terminal beta-propeller domain-containing protein [Saprospiraceae bacterium]
AITINEGDELLDAKLTTGNSEILMAIKSGRAIRFPERTVRPMGRSATGVRGVSLADDNDKVVGLICVDPEDATQTILVVSENGFGKRSLLEDYRITNRGGKGVKTINVTEKTGELVTIKVISDEDDLMITNRSGILIRIAASGLRVMGRATQGVKLIRIEDGDSISDIAVVKHEPEEETGESDNSTLDNDVTTDTDNDSSTENADE